MSPILLTTGREYAVYKTRCVERGTTVTENSRRGQTEKILCAQCPHHVILETYDVPWDDEEAGVSGSSTHDFLKCLGCESSTLRITSWFSEAPGEPGVTTYPPRGEQQAIRTPKNFEAITFGGPLDSVYRQTVYAFNHRLATLAGAGVRLVIEGVCKERGINDGPVVDATGVTHRRDDLAGRINGLVEKGTISTQQAETLHQIRFLGNDATHELDLPSVNSLSIAIDIVEHILEQVYEQPDKARALAARKRPGKK